MNYEKLYKDALEKAKEVYNRKDATDGGKLILESMFPELKESEDERIRKEIISFITDRKNWFPKEETKSSWIAWLEKQGEQKQKQYDIDVLEKHITKDSISELAHTVIARNGWEIVDAKEQKPTNKIEPKFNVGDTMRTLQEAVNGVTDGMPVVVSIDEEYYHCNNETIAIKDQNDYEYPPMNRMQKPIDKVEPKFKVGDWVVFNNQHNSIYQVEKIENYQYTIRHIFGGSMPLSYSSENMLRRWTIQDAKDGDVLSYVTDEEDLWIMIYWSLYKPYEGHVHYHALLVNNNFSDKGTCCVCIDDLKPATKKQRDLLFQKMKESGYEWDAEKKELKKIELNPAWNEEDEQYLLVCKNALAKYQITDKWDARIISQWLESIKQKIRWKPSEDQMKALHDLNLTGDISYVGQGQVLIELYNDLKKLK